MELVERALLGERRSIARLITLIENDGSLAQKALSQLYPYTGKAHIVGITGATGTGKSTLVNEIAKAYRKKGKTVGIIAVDPSSPFSGGAFLGDRIRMRDLFEDEGVFIRSMATRGSLGGLARATADAAKVLDAAGYEKIFVETVGAGQSEVEIARTAHTTIVVTSPGLGDEIQAIKAGITEIADVFVVNKADREGAERTAMALQMVLNFNPSLRCERGWSPPIIKTIALRGEGIEELIEAIEGHIAYLVESGEMGRRERSRIEAELESILRQKLLSNLLNRASEGEFESLIERILQRKLDPYSAAEMLIGSFAN
jgi:LAO/AO transport system kinase